MFKYLILEPSNPCFWLRTGPERKILLITASIDISVYQMSFFAGVFPLSILLFWVLVDLQATQTGHFLIKCVLFIAGDTLAINPQSDPMLKSSIACS